jgi:hypothetical protein
MSEQQALNYSETLKSAISEVKEFKQKFKFQSENKSVTRAAQEGDCV